MYLMGMNSKRVVIGENEIDPSENEEWLRLCC